MKIKQEQLPTTVLKLSLLPAYRHLGIAAPARARPGDAGFDIVSAVNCRILSGAVMTVETPFILAETPEYLADGSDYYIKVNSRSGLAARHGLFPITGTIDKGYRGQIKIVLMNAGALPVDISVGDRIAQLVVHKIEAESLRFELTDEIAETERGSAGFGSSGK